MKRDKKYTDMTYKELIDHKGQTKARNYVAADAKARWTRAYGEKKACESCGFDYGPAIQISHLIAVAKFPLRATLAVINGLWNLAALCANCHRKYDDGVLNELDFDDYPGHF